LFKSIEEKIDHAIQDVRTISHNLMPEDFQSKEFTQILRDHMSMMMQHSNIQFDFYLDEQINLMDKEIQISVFRMLTELLKNIITHANATRATVQIICHRDEMVLQIEDNGKGFKPEAVYEGVGLKSIRSRLKYLNGKLNIDSGKLGTNLIIEIPVNYGKA
jgi:signal transduction histidine kinase